MKRSFGISSVAYISWVFIFLIVIGLAKIHPDYLMAARSLEPEFNMYRAVFTMAVFLIGVLIEHERLLLALKRGFGIQWVGLVVSILIIFTLLIPAAIGMTLFGFGLVSTIMQTGLFRGILSVCSGILFSQSITIKREKI